MITVGSVTRAEAAKIFDFLGEGHRGRRTAIRALTHAIPEFVFWIHPDGRLHDARTNHKAHPPRGFEHILDDEPDYGGFLRGRVVRHSGHQLIAVYCREEALASDTAALQQLLTGLSQMPIPIEEEALVLATMPIFTEQSQISGNVPARGSRRPPVSTPATLPLSSSALRVL